ncbi:hypothetical protein [Bordetella bronchiseptica]|uniref:hypothetical protein n=1 Tax=Bordetella bronchiseptica TaxID=518 RepID=UPI00070F6238|nr:hypothetical protein [Bordetella bronchiseptica]
MPYDPMNQVHPGPQEGIDRITGDATQARTGNTEREQETWFAGVEEGQRRAEHNAAVRSAWMPIESAPKDGTEILAWRHDCGQFIASYTSADAFPMTQDELDAMDEETLFAKDWFTQWPDATRLDGSEAPTHWQPLPAAPGSPAAVAPGDAQDERQAFEAWAEKKKMPLARIGQQYDDFWVDHAWNGWQARARLSAPATDDTPSRFTISASDRFELTGAVGLLRGCGYGGPATALQRVLDAESASFSVQGEDDARDAGRYRTVRQVAADKENGYALMAEASREVGIEVGQYPTPEQFDAVVDLVAAQQGKGSKA